MLRKAYHYLKVYGLSRFVWYFYSEVLRLVTGRIKNTYSQDGEDIVIDHLLSHRKQGFYVDVGAYDPTRFSNTKKFYLKGWRGINIEPDPYRIKKFYQQRKKDINLNMGIANKNGSLKYFKFEVETLSTFSPNVAKSYIAQGYKLEKTSSVTVKKLGTVLEKNCKNNKIDFLSIDTEGLDYEVLKSNNWKKFKPKLICIESHNFNNSENKLIKDQSPEKLLSRMGYKKVYENSANSIFQYK